MAPKSETNVETPSAPQAVEEARDESIHVTHLHRTNTAGSENAINAESVANQFAALMPYNNFLAFANDCKQKGHDHAVHNMNVYRKSDLSEQIVERSRQFRDKFRDEGLAWTLEANPQIAYGPNDKLWIEETDEHVRVHIYVHREGEIDLEPYKPIMTHVFGNVDPYLSGFYLYNAFQAASNVEVVVISIPLGNNVLSLSRTRGLNYLMTHEEAIELFGQEAIDQFVASACESNDQEEDNESEEEIEGHEGATVQCPVS